MKEEVSNDREEGQIYLEVSRYVNRKGRGPQEPSQEWVHKHGGRLKANKGTYQNKTSREKENRGGEPHRGSVVQNTAIPYRYQESLKLSDSD